MSPKAILILASVHGSLYHRYSSSCTLCTWPGDLSPAWPGDLSPAAPPCAICLICLSMTVGEFKSCLSYFASITISLLAPNQERRVVQPIEMSDARAIFKRRLQLMQTRANNQFWKKGGLTHSITRHFWGLKTCFFPSGPMSL